MNWEALGAIAEGLGAAGVIVTLIYLAGQVRQNSKQQRASTTAATSQIQSVYMALMIQDPEVARIWWEGLADLGSLSESDRQRFNPLTTLVFQGLSHRHQFVLDGVASPGTLDEVNTSLSFLFGNPGIRQWWPDWSQSYNQGFRDHVDKRARQNEAAP